MDAFLHFAFFQLICIFAFCTFSTNRWLFLLIFPFLQCVLSIIGDKLVDLRFTDERGHKEILNRLDYPEERVINARMSPGKVLLLDGGTLYGQSHGFDNISVPGDIHVKKNTYSLKIKLTEGSLTGIDHWPQCLIKTHRFTMMVQVRSQQ